MLRQIKEHIENRYLDYLDERDERRLKRWLERQDYWRWENIYLPDMYKFKAFGVEEWRN